LKPSRSNSTSTIGFASSASGSRQASSRASARRLPSPVSTSVSASSREVRSIATFSRKVSISRAMTATSDSADSPTATGFMSVRQP
jgi:hypothetical protein